MLTILEGQISFGGMHDALEAISKHKNIKNGLVRITSNSGSGLIGVFCGRFITGAVLTLTGETGFEALKRLLTAHDGTFAFMDAKDEVLPDLKQSLAVDIPLLLASVDLSSAERFPSEESLTGMAAPEAEAVKLIDTNADFGGEELQQSNADRIDRINQTYQRILSLGEYQKERTPDEGAGTPPEAAERRGQERAESQQEYVRNPNLDLPTPMADSVEAPLSLPLIGQPETPQFTPTSSPAATEFKRLKDWEDKSAVYKSAGTAIALLVVALLIMYFWPYLQSFLPGVAH